MCTECKSCVSFKQEVLRDITKLFSANSDTPTVLSNTSAGHNSVLQSA